MSGDDASSPAGDSARGGASPGPGAPSGPDVAPPGPDRPAPVVRERRRRTDHVDLPFAVTLAVGFAAGMLLASLVSAAVARLQGLLVTVVVSLFLSFAVEPGVQWLARRGVRRSVGTLIVFFVTALLLTAFVAAMTTLVVGQVRTLVEEGPAVLSALAEQARSLPGEMGESVSDWLQRQRAELPRRVPDVAGQLATGVLGVGSTLAGAIIQLLTALLVTFYLVSDGPRLRRTLSSRLPPDRQRELLAMWELAIAKTGGYVYSRVLTAVASAVFHVVVFTIIGIPYPMALGVWVGLIASLVPVIGTYLAGALPLMIALADAPGQALWVLAAIVVYQQIENYLVVPRITAATMELHPAIAFLSVLVGAALLGAPGALLALPAAAIVAALVSAYGERHELMAHGLLHEERRRPPEPT